MKFDICNRWTGKVQFTAEIDCSKDVSHSIKIGLAVKWAIKTGANLAGANLAGADLAGADLAGADLAYANLTGADLAGACLRGANFAGANLTGADLTGADLAGACLRGANFAHAKSIVSLGYPDGWTAVGWWKDGDPWVRVGCHTKSLADAKVYWAGKSNRQEVMAALAYFDAVIAIRAASDQSESA